jgi:hypothetical protein
MGYICISLKLMDSFTKLHFPRIFKIVLQWENVVSQVHRFLDSGIVGGPP